MDVLQELEWLHGHQEWGSFEDAVRARYTHYFGLGVRLREEDLRIFAVELAREAGFTEPRLWGFVSLACQFFVGLGMVGAWSKVAEQIAAHQALEET